MEFNTEQLELLNICLDNQIGSNESFLDDVKDKEEKEYWIQEIKELKDLRNKLNIELNVVVQEFKIDEMIENQIDSLIEMKRSLI